MASNRAAAPLTASCLPVFKVHDAIDKFGQVQAWISGDFTPEDLLVSPNDSCEDVLAKMKNMATVMASGASLAVTMGELPEGGLVPDVVARAKKHMNWLELMHFKNWELTGKLPTLDLEKDRRPLPIAFGGYAPNERRRLALARLYRIRNDEATLEHLVYLHQAHPNSIHIIKTMERVIAKERADTNSGLLSTPQMKEIHARMRLEDAANARRRILIQESQKSRAVIPRESSNVDRMQLKRKAGASEEEAPQRQKLDLVLRRSTRRQSSELPSAS